MFLPLEVYLFKQKNKLIF